MEVGLRILSVTLALSALSGCALWRSDEAPAPQTAGETQSAASSSEGSSSEPIINPQVERREIHRPKIDTEDFEIGPYVGVLSIEDFGSNVVYGARLAYHLTEDFFLEGTFGHSKAGKTSYEVLSGSAQLLTKSQREYEYYALSVGWNALPGEIFVGPNRAYNTAFYVIAGIGATSFADDDRFTVNAGFGYRVLPTDWLSVHIDFRDHLFDTDLLGDKKVSQNLEAHLGLSFFF
ncbi:MAG: outer membrane beta-barrel domain-containing protein [Steroidobacteraceae bacterium]